MQNLDKLALDVDREKDMEEDDDDDGEEERRHEEIKTRSGYSAVMTDMLAHPSYPVKMSTLWYREQPKMKTVEEVKAEAEAKAKSDALHLMQRQTVTKTPEKSIDEHYIEELNETIRAIKGETEFTRADLMAVVHERQDLSDRDLEFFKRGRMSFMQGRLTHLIHLRRWRDAEAQVKIDMYAAKTLAEHPKPAKLLNDFAIAREDLHQATKFMEFVKSGEFATANKRMDDLVKYCETMMGTLRQHKDMMDNIEAKFGPCVGMMRAMAGAAAPGIASAVPAGDRYVCICGKTMDDKTNFGRHLKCQGEHGHNEKLCRCQTCKSARSQP